MTSRTANESIFITGAGGGIGSATARLFAAKGWQVGGCDLDTAAVEALADAIGRQHFTPYRADVRDRASVAHAIDEFAARHGNKLGAVFANAGVRTGAWASMQSCRTTRCGCSDPGSHPSMRG